MSTNDRLTKPSHKISMTNRFEAVQASVENSYKEDVAKYTPNTSSTDIVPPSENSSLPSIDVFSDDVRKVLDLSSETATITLYSDIYEILTRAVSESKNKSLTAKTLLNNIVYDWFQANQNKVKEDRKTGGKSKLSKKLLG